MHTNQPTPSYGITTTAPDQSEPMHNGPAAQSPIGPLTPSQPAAGPAKPEAGPPATFEAVASGETPAQQSATKMSYKFQRLREKLREAIRGGEFTGKLPGERALANRFHVNAKTLSKALTDLAAEGLLDRSIGRGTYVKGTAPQPSTHGRWLVICDAGQADGCLISHLKRVNEHLEVVTGPAELGRMRPSFLNQFDAVIDMASGTPEKLLRDLVVRNVPVVSVGREPRTYSTHAVLADGALGATRLARDLLLAGHRHITAVEVAGSAVIAHSLRQAAARYAPGINGDSSEAIIDLLAPEESQSLAQPGDCAGSFEGGATAFICDSVASARQIRTALQKRGAQIPGDVCLAAVGYACETGDRGSNGCGYPCSGYFVSCRQIADGVFNLLTDTPSRPALLWLAGEFIDTGTILGSGDDRALRGPVVHPAANVTSSMGAMRLGSIPV